MKVLVCGGRDYKDRKNVYAVLDRLHELFTITYIVNGGAKGADKLAYQWAKKKHIEVETFEADWKLHGKAAGPIRNKQMLDESDPDKVVYFSGGKGTRDMVTRALQAGYIPIKGD